MGSVTARGIVWNTTGSPTTANNTAELETGADLADEAFSGLVGSPSTSPDCRHARFSSGVMQPTAPATATPFRRRHGLYGTGEASPPALAFSAITANQHDHFSWSDPGGATGAEGAIVVMKPGTRTPALTMKYRLDGSDGTASIHASPMPGAVPERSVRALPRWCSWVPVTRST